MDDIERVQASPSYAISVPKRLNCENDGGVLSYWRPGSEIVLQLSSRVWAAPVINVTAAESLENHIPELSLSKVHDESVHPERCPDWKCAAGNDREGNLWLICHAVWPGLRVLATVIGPATLPESEFEWAHNAIRSIEKTSADQA
ncbi:MAG: hypothetical protein K8T20_09575 [Planctomycetes bacterium]|nr:hypothetical protein [Planctomycetota bacterium]